MNYEFKGSMGKTELVYMSGMCIGIGIKQHYGLTIMTANSILPDTDEEYEKEKVQIESDMQMYSTSIEMFEFIKKVEYMCDRLRFPTECELREMRDEAQTILKKATTINP